MRGHQSEKRVRKRGIGELWHLKICGKEKMRWISLLSFSSVLVFHTPGGKRFLVGRGPYFNEVHFKWRQGLHNQNNCINFIVFPIAEGWDIIRGKVFGRCNLWWLPKTNARWQWTELGDKDCKVNRQLFFRGGTEIASLPLPPKISHCKNCHVGSTWKGMQHVLPKCIMTHCLQWLSLIRYK